MNIMKTTGTIVLILALIFLPIGSLQSSEGDDAKQGVSFNDVVIKNQNQCREESLMVRISVDENGSELTDTCDDPNCIYVDCDGSSFPTITPDGRYVVFQSDMQELPGHGYKSYYNDQYYSLFKVNQLYIRDRDVDKDGVFDEEGIENSTTVLISKDNNGNPANGDCGGYLSTDPLYPEHTTRSKDCRETHSTPIDITDDGRYVVFTSYATNLDTSYDFEHRATHVYLHDRDADNNGEYDELGNTSTTLIDVKFDHILDDYAPSNGAWDAQISHDGCYVIFCSNDAELIPSDDDRLGVFIRDLTKGVGEPGYITVVPSLDDGENIFCAPTVSKAARNITFCESFFVNPKLVNDIFLYDSYDHELHRITNTINEEYSSTFPHISDRGRSIAFTTNYPLTDNDDQTDDFWDVYLWESVSNAFSLVSRSAETGNSINGDSGNGNAGFNSLTISPDGRYVCFASCNNLVEYDDNSKHDIYLYDKYTDTMKVVSMVQTGQLANDNSDEWPSVSVNGPYVAFTSSARNLIEGDTNEKDDVYVRFIQPLLGDVNNDGFVNFDDITPFITSLMGLYQFYQIHPYGNWKAADCNQDGFVNFDDIDAFVDLLTS